MSDFVFPTSAELREIAQDLLPRLQQDRPIFQHLPVRDVDASVVLWEQEDNYVGLQAVRGLGGAPGKVQKVGLKRYSVIPGAYGEFINIDEIELTNRRQYGTFGQPANIADLVLRAQRQLLVRRLDRVEKIGWLLLSTGTFSVSTPTGAVAHTDTFDPQTVSGSAWGTAGSGTPLADFRAVQLKARGHSVRFDQSARAYMNRVTLNKLLANTNAADIYGRRTAGLATPNNLADVNSILLMDGLPQIVPYDEGYLDDSGTFVPFIADNKTVVVGTRADRAPIGEYQMTRNANNPGMAPGAYMKVIDHGEDRVPRSIEVHDGHNGGPALYMPSAVVILTTT